MPRDPNGVHALPSGSLVVDGQTAQASQHTPPLQDISAALTESLPRTGVAGMLANLPMGGFKLTSVGAGTVATDGINKSQLDAVATSLTVPAGIGPIPFAGSVTPTGWLRCNGAAVSRTAYAALFTAIGTTYGAGDGSTTFNVPDMRGEFLRGLDEGRGVDAARVLGSAQAADTAPHSHTAASVVTDPGHTHPIASQETNYSGGGGVMRIFNATVGGLTVSTPSTTYNTSSSTTGISVATTINNSTGSETRPRNIAVPFIIKT